MRYCLLIIGCLLTSIIQGQEYRFQQYRVEDGLPSDVIKAVAQDSLGFFWIATDDGLVKYDGIQFHTYKSAFLSQYTKGLLNTHDGRLRHRHPARPAVRADGRRPWQAPPYWLHTERRRASCRASTKFSQIG